MEGYFALMIPILGISLGFFGVWTHHQQRMIKLRIQEAGALRGGGGLSPERAREVEELGERVKVLERIVTDSGYSVAAEIEALSHDREAAPQPAEREIERSL